MIHNPITVNIAIPAPKWIHSINSCPLVVVQTVSLALFIYIHKKSTTTLATLETTAGVHRADFTGVARRLRLTNEVNLLQTHTALREFSISTNTGENLGKAFHSQSCIYSLHITRIHCHCFIVFAVTISTKAHKLHSEYMYRQAYPYSYGGYYVFFAKGYEKVYTINLENGRFR